MSGEKRGKIRNRHSKSRRDALSASGLVTCCFKKASTLQEHYKINHIISLIEKALGPLTDPGRLTRISPNAIYSEISRWIDTSMYLSKVSFYVADYKI